LQSAQRAFLWFVLGVSDMKNHSDCSLARLQVARFQRCHEHIPSNLFIEITIHLDILSFLVL
jgi:hypothetical protein